MLITRAGDAVAWAMRIKLILEKQMVSKTKALFILTCSYSGDKLPFCLDLGAVYHIFSTT